MIPILAPGLVAVALFGFTLSYDEFARTLQTAGSLNTLPLEIWSMTLNVTSPSLYALGTVTTIISFIIIVVCLGAIARIQKRRASSVLAIEGGSYGNGAGRDRTRRHREDLRRHLSRRSMASISKFPTAPIVASSVHRAAARRQSCE